MIIPSRLIKVKNKLC